MRCVDKHFSVCIKNNTCKTLFVDEKRLFSINIIKFGCVYWSLLSCWVCILSRGNKHCVSLRNSRHTLCPVVGSIVERTTTTSKNGFISTVWQLMSEWDNHLKTCYVSRLPFKHSSLNSKDCYIIRYIAPPSRLLSNVLENEVSQLFFLKPKYLLSVWRANELNRRSIFMK